MEISNKTRKSRKESRSKSLFSPLRGFFILGMHTFDTDILKVPENLVRWATKYEHLDDVAMLLLFKRVFRSGHYHSLKVPQALGISRPTFRKYLKIFYDNNWAQKWENGFRLFSLNTIQKQIYQVGSEYRYSKIITLKNYGNKYNLKTQLRWVMLKHKHDQIRFAQSCKENCIHNLGNGEKLPKSLRKLVMATPVKVQMSVDQIGRAFKRSKSTGYRIKEELKDMRMLKARPHPVKIIKTNVSVEEWYNFQRTNWDNKDFNYSSTETYKNGIIFENRPDIIYLENPAAHFTLNNTVSHFFNLRKAM